MEFDPLSSSSHTEGGELHEKELTGGSAVVPLVQIVENDNPTAADTLECAEAGGDISGDVITAQNRSDPEDLKVGAPPPNSTDPKDASSESSAAVPSPKEMSTPEKTSCVVQYPSNSPNVTPAKPPLPPGVAQEEHQRKLSKKKKKKKHKRSSISSPSQGKTPSKAEGMSDESITSQMNEIDAFLQSLKMGGGLPGVGGLAPPSSSVSASHPQGLVAPPPDVGQNLQSGSAVVAAAAPSSRIDMAGRGTGLALIQMLVSESSSEDSSSDSEESSSESSDDEDDKERLQILVEQQESEDEGEKTRGCGPMARGEIHYKELPPLESCAVAFPEGGDLIQVGVVSHVTEELVVIQGFQDTPPVDEGTVLWSEEKTSLSIVFEIFGPVRSPYYSVHVHSPQHAQKLGLTAGTKVFVVRDNQELTKYVFTQQLLQQRGTDASWKDDAEVPEEFQEFSDDEAEVATRKARRLGKRQHKPAASRTADKNTPIISQATPNPRQVMPTPQQATHNPQQATPPLHQVASIQHQATPFQHQATPIQHQAPLMATSVPLKAMSTSSRATPPAPTYTSNPKMSAYFPRSSSYQHRPPPPNATPFSAPPPMATPINAPPPNSQMYRPSPHYLPQYSRAPLDYRYPPHSYQGPPPLEPRQLPHPSSYDPSRPFQTPPSEFAYGGQQHMYNHAPGAQQSTSHYPPVMARNPTAPPPARPVPPPQHPQFQGYPHLYQQN